MSDEQLTAASTCHWSDAKSDEEIVRFGSDGVWVNPDLPVDEAARKFLKIVNEAWGAHFTRPAVEAERVRIVAIIRDELRAWHDGERDYAHEDGATDSLQAVLNSVEGTFHD